MPKRRKLGYVEIMSKRFLTVLFLALCLASLPYVPTLKISAVAQGVFLSEVPDLPLMPELAEVPEAGLVFDKPGGRFVESYAQGQTSVEAVQDFYARTLPQLGWQSAIDGWQREGESLKINVLAQEDGYVTAHFLLEPR